ncbi:uncharacterized protein A4U43_C04F5900 [Asparagus officinalis]|uniref:JmjC domain-containing protein n=2 Tax=Asparagus officinalis TaxID=4686 RepID=A0A5P1F323_ASPOF|nr:uncharacterized protein A4U43_C04F5900 [Asparagus officinalis]
MKKFNKKTPFSPLEVEALFWRACADKPFSVEYANDMPGSGFVPIVKKWGCKEEEVGNVGESGWNMRGVSRAKGSLLRFMKEEIPGVTSPMIYVAMMFSWFAWHVEDHELHSLNYLHLGSGKTWYGVPRDAAIAFEDVVRVHGYGGEVNPLVTFTILGEKTTVMSPEVLLGAGIPCCRLVQNPGEFVVTFPGAYHSGFNHGFNCAEAANIATPGWLRVAKEAAVRRASINYPPMVSHFQLLYALALSLCSRVPLIGVSEPRSSRLKDKMRGEGEVMVKEIFVQNVIETNDLLSALLNKGSSCIVLPHNMHDSPLCSNSLLRSQLKMKPRLSLGLCSREEALEASRVFPANDVILGRNAGIEHSKASATSEKSGISAHNSSGSDSQHGENENESAVHSDGLLDHGLLSCVTCGILSFTCVAVVRPKQAAARYLMSADCGFLNEQNIVSGENSNRDDKIHWRRSTSDLLCDSEQLERHAQYRSPSPVHVSDHNFEDNGSDAACRGASALALLASAYGDSSDLDEDGSPATSPRADEDNDSSHVTRCANINLPESDCQNDSDNEYDEMNGSTPEFSSGDHPGMLDNLEDNGEMETSSSSIKSIGETRSVDYEGPENKYCTTGTAKICQSNVKMERIASGSVSTVMKPNSTRTSPSRNNDAIRQCSVVSAIERSDKDSSRMHVFCLEHALEVEKLLHPLGGVNIMILCHPDYPKIETEAKLLAEELETDYEWKSIDFRGPTQKDLESIRAAMEDEESMPTSSDWAVKLGINLFYSANLSKSPLYSKQLPYNAVIYRAFGCKSPNNSPLTSKSSKRRPGRQRKIVVAGKWCGKVWMRNQVHPLLSDRKDDQEQKHERFYSKSNSEIKSEEVETEIKNEKIVSRKSSRSRKRKKRPLSRASAKKQKCVTPQVMDKKAKVSDTSAAQTSSTKHSRVLRSCRKSDVKYESEEEPTTVRSSRRLKAKSETKTKPTITRSTSKLHIEQETEEAPNTRLRTKPSKSKDTSANPPINKQSRKKKPKTTPNPIKEEEEEEAAKDYTCNIEGCTMSFSTKHDLALHKKDICPEEGCGKKFFSHKYLVQHKKVHLDDRPLACPWKGCKMRFKWAWARTEHIRVHTGDRPYICSKCSQTFRFVSDFSRHKRKTGHLAKKGRR